MKVTLPPHYKEEADLFEKQLKRHSVKLRNAGHTYLLDLYKFCIKPHDDLGVRANPSENRSKKSSLEAMEHAQALNQGIREIGDTNKEKYILQQLRSAINRLAYLAYALKDEEYLRYIHDGRTSSPFSTQRKKLKGDLKKLEALAEILKKRYIRDAFVGMTTVYMDYIATLDYSEVQYMVSEILQNGNITTPYDHKNRKKIRDYFFLTLSNGSTNFPFSPQITQEYLRSFMCIKDAVEDAVEDTVEDLADLKKEAESDANEIKELLIKTFSINSKSKQVKRDAVMRLAEYLGTRMSKENMKKLKELKELKKESRKWVINYVKRDLGKYKSTESAYLVLDGFLDSFDRDTGDTQKGSKSIRVDTPQDPDQDLKKIKDIAFILHKGLYEWILQTGEEGVLVFAEIAKKLLQTSKEKGIEIPSEISKENRESLSNFWGTMQSFFNEIDKELTDFFKIDFEDKKLSSPVENSSHYIRAHLEAFIPKARRFSLFGDRGLDKLQYDIKIALDAAGILVPSLEESKKEVNAFYIKYHGILKGVKDYKKFSDYLQWPLKIKRNPSRLGQRAKNLYLDESLNSRSILAKVSTTKQPSVISNIQSAGSCVSNLVLAFHDKNMKNFRLLKSHKTLTIEGTKGDEEAKVKGLAMLQGAGIIYYAMVIMALDHLMTVDAEELWVTMEDELDARVGYKSNPKAKLAENFTNLDLRKEVVRKSYLQYMYQKLAV